MLRGFRWQFIAFVMAIILFAIGLVYRNSVQPPPLPTPQTVVATETTEPEPSPTDEPIQATLPTPFPETPVAQSVSSATDAHSYHEGMVGRIQRLNPIFAHLNAVDNDITRLIYEGLMTTNDFGEPVLNLASDYVVSNDGLEYVFTLRSDVLWQDGQPFNADDVVYTMSLLSSPAYAQYSPTATFWQTVETQKLTDTLIRFRLTQPLGSFTTFLTVGILPEHALTGTTVDQLVSHPFNLSPIGTGPYQLSSLQSDNDERIDRIQLQFAPVFAQRPEGQSGYTFQNLTFHLYDNSSDAIAAYQSGQLDALANVAPRSELMFLSDSRIYTQVEPEVTLLIFNWDAPDGRAVFADRRVRQALSYSLNQIDIIQRHLATDAAYADSPLIPGSWAYQSNAIWSIFDATQAQQVLESTTLDQPEAVSDTEVEAPVDAGSFYTFSILIPESESLRAIANDIATQWRQIGFDVSVDSVDAATHKARLVSGEFQAAIVTLPVGSDPDVYRYWHPGQTENGQNYGAVSNNEVAEVLEVARRDNNGINRTNLYFQFQERFAEQAIAIPLYYPLYTFVARDSIAGIKLGFLGTSSDRFRTIARWRPQSPTS